MDSPGLRNLDLTDQVQVKDKGEEFKPTFTPESKPSIRVLHISPNPLNLSDLDPGPDPDPDPVSSLWM